MNLYRFIDWFMVLSEALSKRFNTQHKEYEEEQQMFYITTAERIGREDGIAIGMEEGMLSLDVQVFVQPL